MLAHHSGLSAKIARHPPIDSQSNTPRRKSVPRSDFVAGQLVEDMLRRQPPQRVRRRPVFRFDRYFLLFTFRESLQIGAAGTKAELPIKPESARFNRLFVILAQLIGVDRETRRAHDMT